jgi:hypothetical protein
MYIVDLPFGETGDHSFDYYKPEVAYVISLKRLLVREEN